MPQRSRPIAVDLFSGAGGLSLGFEQAGFDIVAALELDPIHLATHELNFPYSKAICADVRRLTGEHIRNLIGLTEDDTIDVVIGGPPCQGFSLMGRRVLEDPRNELVLHFFRLVIELTPRSFVMENVPGMVTGGHTQLVRELVDRFRDAGYQVADYETLNATNFDVPQDRERLFLLGTRSDAKPPSYPKKKTLARAIVQELDGLWSAPPSDSGRAKEPCPSVQDAIGDLPLLEDRNELFESDELRVELGVGSEYALRMRGDILDLQDFSYLRLHDPELLTGCLRARHTADSQRRFRKQPEGTTEQISRFFKLHRDGVCNTLRAGTASDHGAFTAPRPIHYSEPRCITVREAARLHSFPDWFRFHRTIWHGFRQIGNAVPPLMARSVAENVLSSLDVSPARPAAVLCLGSSELTTYNMRQAASHYSVSRNVIPQRTRPGAPRTVSVVSDSNGRLARAPVAV